MIELLRRNRNFKFLLTGSLISSFGDYLYDIAIILLIYDLTKSINSIAFMWLSKGALRILILYLGGLITDHYNRKLIITITNLISAPIALMFIFVDKNALWIVYLGVFLLQALNDIDNCSENAMLPELVHKKDLPKANTIFSFTNQILMLLSLALSGLIYKLAGADILFLINALSFTLASGFFKLIQYKASTSNSISNLKIFDISVFQVLSNNRIILLVIITSIPIAIIGRVYDVTNILIADSKLNITSMGIIYFRYAMAVGGFLTPIMLKLKMGRKSFDSFILSCIALVLCLVGFALSNNIYIALFILAAFGFSSSLQGIYFRTLIQENIKINYLGRVFSFYRIIMTAISLITVSLIPSINQLIGIEKLYTYTAIPALILFVFIFYKYNNKTEKLKAFKINEV